MFDTTFKLLINLAVSVGTNINRTEKACPQEEAQNLNISQYMAPSD